ncbi:hypothetical protein [Albirhodobacter sp. R86504]|uniref:hypothetical protein n=1 Tax=Albirhodobacter sp. R86504 TaxID=3093848 RepID=UPI00366C7507
MTKHSPYIRRGADFAVSLPTLPFAIEMERHSPSSKPARVDEQSKSNPPVADWIKLRNEAVAWISAQPTLPSVADIRLHVKCSERRAYKYRTIVREARK